MGSIRKGMLSVLIAAVLWGSSRACAQYIMEQSRISSQLLTTTHLIFVGLILLMLSLIHGDRIFSIINNYKDAISLSIFSVVDALTIQLAFLPTIGESNAVMATVLQFLSPTIIITWFSLMRKSRPGIPVLHAILTSLIETFLLVIRGNPTLLSISLAALLWSIASAFAAVFYTAYPSTLIVRYGTSSTVGWSMLIGGLILLPSYARQGTNFVANGSLILALFYLAVIGTSSTLSLYLKGAQLISGPKASVLSCAEPLNNTLLSLLLLRITFILPGWLGMLLILLLVILISTNSRRRVRKISRPTRYE